MVVYWQQRGILSLHSVFLIHVGVCTSQRKHRERLEMILSLNICFVYQEQILFHANQSMHVNESWIAKTPKQEPYIWER